MKESVDVKRSVEETIDLAYERALKSVSGNRIKEDDFIDLYGAEGIAEDKRYIAKHEALFQVQQTPAEKEALRYALILEAIICDQIELNEWLGEGIETQQSSRFDDIKNGVDVILDIDRDDHTQHLALAIDAALGENLEKKFVRIRDEIDRGELTSIKYHIDPLTGSKGERLLVPRVVIGMDRLAIARLAELWIDGRNKELSEHPAQIQFIDQMIEQLTVFMDRVRVQKDKENILKIYGRQLKILNDIREKKKGIAGLKTTQEFMARDRVYQAIRSNLDRFSVLGNEPEK